MTVARCRFTVTGRSGIGAGRERTDAQRAGIVNPGDRAASRAHFGEIHERKAHGIAAALHGAAAVRLARCFELGDNLRNAINDRAALRRRAAHVEREQALQTDLPAQRRRGDHAAGRPALDESGGDAEHGRCRREPAVAAHHIQQHLDSGAANAGDETFEIAFDDRRERGVDHRGREALVLAVFGIDLGRERHARAGQRRAQRFGDAPFVLVVGVRMQQADGHRGDVASRQLGAGLLERCLVERHEHVSAIVQAFADGEAIFAFDQRMRALHEEVVHLAAALAPDLDDVAESVGRHHRDARQLQADLAEQRVRGDRRRMREKLDRRRLVVARQQSRERIYDGALGLVGRGGNFERDGRIAPRFDRR